MAVRRRRRARKVKPEDLLVIRVCNHIKMKYPDLPFRVDLVDRIGLKAGKEMKAIHGKWSKGYPDLLLCHCQRNKKGRIKFGGLYLELKATKTVHNTEHTRTQAVYHAELRMRGYKVMFVCGFDEAIQAINEYLK